MFDLFVLIKLTHSCGGLCKTETKWSQSKAGAEWTEGEQLQPGEVGLFAYSEMYLYLSRKRCRVTLSTFSAMTGVFSGIKKAEGTKFN